MTRHGYFKDENGASAAEFALVVLPFTVMVLGIIGTCLMLYANQTLQFAVEAAARCRSVSQLTDTTARCQTDSAAETYALAQYKGPGITPTFTASTAGCGHTVSGSANFPLNAGIISISVPLSATACFP
jgi:Flp pilus assembly protein TadG